MAIHSLLMWHNHWIINGNAVMLEWRGPEFTGAEIRQWDAEKGSIHELQGLRQAIELTRHEIEKALRVSKNNKTRAADLLGISRFTLQRKLDKFAEIGVTVVALSGDTEERARKARDDRRRAHGRR